MRILGDLADLDDLGDLEVCVWNERWGGEGVGDLGNLRVLTLVIWNYVSGMGGG